MRPPRLRCTLFPLIYPPHLLGSYKRQLYGFVLFSRLTKRNLASYVISVRRTKSLLTASFRFYLTIDTLAVQLYTSLSPRRVRDFHPLERAHGAQTKNSGKPYCIRLPAILILFCFISTLAITLYCKTHPEAISHYLLALNSFSTWQCSCLPTNSLPSKSSSMI